MRHARTEGRADVYEGVTRQIVEAIEAGCDRWRMPWHVRGESAWSPMNVETGRGYRGINQILLWVAASHEGFTSGTWGTFRQWTNRGARVKKGARATTVVFWRISDRDIEPGDRPASPGTAAETRRRSVFATSYPVFNADQVEGYTPSERPTLSDDERIEVAEGFFGRIPARISHGTDVAFYARGDDFISLPHFKDFKSPARYYAVLAHELTHWTGAPHRLNRDLGSRFGWRQYAAEELVAELGAAFLCSGLGLPLSPRRDHAPYISHWLELLKSDTRAIFTAASRAQEAVDYLLTLHEAALRDAA
jgi:antirestriction protein ArdC